MNSYLTEEQVAKLLEPIHPRRVSSRDGMAYVEAHDVKAHLTRIFGFARWSSEVIDQQLIAERMVQTRNGKEAFYVCYRSIVRLTIHAPDGTKLATYTEGHVGDSTHPTQGDAHGNALTNSESYALKRCCIALGDQFGLSLYNKGQTSKIVGRTLVAMPGEVGAAVDVDADVPQIHPEEQSQTDEPPPAAEPEDKETPAATASKGKEEVAAELVDQLNAIDLTQPRGAVLRRVTALKIEAGKARVLTVPVKTRDGDVPLGVLMDNAVSQATAA
jgi:DNA topoisomerase VI subunit B